jgi:hypothetical protein
LRVGSELLWVYLVQKPPDGIVRRNPLKKAKMLLQPVLLFLSSKFNFNQGVGTNHQAANDNHQGLG